MLGKPAIFPLPTLSSLFFLFPFFKKTPHKRCRTDYTPTAAPTPGKSTAVRSLACSPREAQRKIDGHVKSSPSWFARCLPQAISDLLLFKAKERRTKVLGTVCSVFTASDEAVSSGLSRAHLTRHCCHRAL